MKKLLKEGLEKLFAQEQIGRCDFHTHSFFTDGVLLPIEQLRRAHVLGHQAYAITDHVSASNLDLVSKLQKDCELALKHWGIVAIPGVEITHVPKEAIEEIAIKAKELGALVIVVHGETLVEPVESGTNLQTARIQQVDILAHPGLLTLKEAKLCKKNDVFVEITSHKNHSVTNGHVSNIGREAEVNFIQNTDTHVPGNMLTYEEAEQFLTGVGFSQEEKETILQTNVRKLLEKIYEKL